MGSRGRYYRVVHTYRMAWHDGGTTPVLTDDVVLPSGTAEYAAADAEYDLRQWRTDCDGRPVGVCLQAVFPVAQRERRRYR